MHTSNHRTNPYLFCAIFVLLTAVAFPQATTRVSVNNAGVHGNGDSQLPVISANGRYVAYASVASNLVPGDANGKSDVFIFDRETQVTSRISVASNGAEGNEASGGVSFGPADLSADGRFVVFSSNASNFVPGDTDNANDIFLHDRTTGTTSRVAWGVFGEQSRYPSISSDGQHISFQSGYALLPGSNNGQDIYLYDVQAGQTTRVSVNSAGNAANSSCYISSISANGLIVAFDSYATNLVTDDTNGTQDVFVHDLAVATTTRVSVSSAGLEGSQYSGSPDLSDDGLIVVFTSDGSNLVPNDTNNVGDVFVHDRASGTTTRVSVNSSGIEANGSSVHPSISPSGRFVVFLSNATNLVANDTNGSIDIFVHDRLSGITTRANVDSEGNQGHGRSSGFDGRASISEGGIEIAFSSRFTNLVPADTNNRRDVFVHDTSEVPPSGAVCFGDGTGSPCPCGNEAIVGQGCLHSGGVGMTIASVGSTSISGDDLVMIATNCPPGNSGIFYSGTELLDPSANLFDGLRCVAGTTLRYRGIHQTNGVAADTGFVAQDPSESYFRPGGTYVFQYFSRDSSDGPTPCGGSANLSPAYAVVMTF